MLETGVRILRLLTAAVTARAALALPVHEQLAAAWHVPADARAAAPRRARPVGRPRVQRLGLRRPRRRLDRRQPHGATIAGLAAINGPRHGGLTRRVAALFDELKKAARSRWRAGAARARPHLHAGLRPHALSRRRRPRRDAVRPAARGRARARPNSPSPSGWRRGRTADRPQAQRRFHHRHGRARARPAQGLPRWPSSCWAAPWAGSPMRWSRPPMAA